LLERLLHCYVQTSKWWHLITWRPKVKHFFKSDSGIKKSNHGKEIKIEETKKIKLLFAITSSHATKIKKKH
jgi:hypothetical protein